MFSGDEDLSMLSISIRMLPEYALYMIYMIRGLLGKQRNFTSIYLAIASRHTASQSMPGRQWLGRGLEIVTQTDGIGPDTIILKRI